METGECAGPDGVRERKTGLAHTDGPLENVTFDLVGCGNPLQLVSEALRYFGLHFQDPIEIPELAEALGTSVGCLDFSFDRIRGVTPARALQAHRLNQLFVALTDRPRQGLKRAIQSCGLAETAGVLALFEEEFGIDMPLFLLTCRRASDDRLFRLRHPDAEALVLPI